MKECMRELKAYKAAMQFLPSGCLAAEAEAEKQEKLSVEMIGSQTGPMSCSEQTELFVRASGQKTGMVYTQKLDANASDVIAQALTNSEDSAAKKAEPMAAADGYEGYACALTLDELSPEPFIHDFSNRRFLDVPTILAEPGVYRAVLSSQAVNNILITAWQMFTAKRARSGATPLAGKENKKIFSDCITIRDYKGGADSKNSVQCGFSWKMDCEGVPSRDLTLVENGVLKGWMHNLSSAAAAGVRSTGNAGRKTLLSGNIHTDMAIMPKNFTIESGTASLEQLIHDCDDGVYVFENYDQFHALNVVSGDFSFPCKAVRIKEGKPVGIMEGLTMTGNVAELFARVEQVGSDRVINPLVMYDSYTVSGPAMLVKSLKISG